MVLIQDEKCIKHISHYNYGTLINSDKLAINLTKSHYMLFGRARF